MVVVAPAVSFHHYQSAGGGGADAVFPLLAAGHCAVDPDAAKSAAGVSSSSIQFWQTQAQAAGGDSPGHKKPLPMLDYGGGGGGSSGVATCHDCGNQAKKDCGHRRCRTCCKSRGFDCPTHVRSTWVPASRRRERQHLAGASAASKKPRLLSSQTTTTSRTSTSNATTPRSFDTTSTHQGASFREGLPRQVRAPAVFRCVRVTSVDDGEDEYAYQAAVTINGHVFKGFLYDHGADDAAAGNDAESGGAVPNISDLHLGNARRPPPHDFYSGGSGPPILGAPGYGNAMN